MDLPCPGTAGTSETCQCVEVLTLNCCVFQGDLKQFLRISKSKDESLKPQPLTTKHKVTVQLWKCRGAGDPGRAASADSSLGSGVSLHTGGPGHGAPLQRQVCPPGFGSQELPGQCPAAGEGLIPEPQQGRVQQVREPERGMGGDQMASVSLPACPARSEYYHFRQAWIPLRWMPPEAVLEDEFSTKSDVWSFGVLMWEVFTHGEMPYTPLADDEVLAGMWSTLCFPWNCSQTGCVTVLVWLGKLSQPAWRTAALRASPREDHTPSQQPFALLFRARSAVRKDEAPAPRGLPFPPGQADAALLGPQP